MAARNPGGALRAAGDALIRIGAIPGLLASWLILPTTVIVLISVVGNYYGMGNLLAWDSDLPMLGRELTMTGLSELQWHLFAVMVMVGWAPSARRGRKSGR